LIEDRPKIVDLKRLETEIDTIIGKNHKGAIVTINDRATGILRMKIIKAKESELVKQAAIELLELEALFVYNNIRQWKFAMHQEIATVLEVDYFANPYSPLERGANENLNGLIRQYIPKSTSFEEITIERIIEIQEKLNNRPRKDLILKHQIYV
jgi:IS30 family transposase